MADTSKPTPRPTCNHAPGEDHGPLCPAPLSDADLNSLTELAGVILGLRSELSLHPLAHQLMAELQRQGIQINAATSAAFGFGFMHGRAHGVQDALTHCFRTHRSFEPSKEPLQ